MWRRILTLFRWAAAMLSMLCAAAAGAQAENLIPNSSFEAGIDYRLAVGRWSVDGMPSASLDKQTRVHGDVSFKIPFSLSSLAAGQQVTGVNVLSAIPIRVREGQRYTFAIHAKSDRVSDGRLILTRDSAGDYTFKPSASKEIRVTRKWRRHSLTFTAARDEQIYWRVQVKSSKPGFLWLDAAQFAPGKIRPYAVAEPIEAALSSARRGRIFSPDEKSEITLGVRNNDLKSPATVAYRLRVFDFYGRALADQVIEQTVPAGKRVMRPVDLGIKRRGLFRAVLQRVGAKTPESELHFSILPKPRPVKAKDGSFGAYLTIGPEPLSIARRMGFSAIATLTSNRRMSYWDQVERKQGQFTWYDREVEMARLAGFELMFNLEPCRTPRWAAKRSRTERIRLWSSYVRAMVGRYGHTVKHWTIGDEVADLRSKSRKRKCWNSAAEYADWHRAGHAAIKSVDPSGVVVLNAWPGFMTKLFRTLDPATVDIAGVNAYHLPDNYLPKARQELDAAGIKGRWAPGIGFSIEPYYRRLIAPRRLKNVNDDSWRALNINLARGVVRTFALGFNRIFHYTATYVGNTNKYSLFESDSGLKPMGVQFAALAWFLDGFESVSSVLTKKRENRWRAHRVDRMDGKTIFTIWGNSSAEQSLLLGGISKDEVTLYDHFTNRMKTSGGAKEAVIRFGREMVFLDVPRTRAAAVEKALQNAVYRIHTLPKAKSVVRKGRYAVVKGLKDGLFRNRPNASLWYRSDRLGWTEVLRHRASSYAARYEPTASGVRIVWEVPQGSGKFFLGPGRIPADLIRDATYERLLPVRKGLRRVRGRITPEGKPMPTTEDIVPADGRTPVDYAFTLRNGLRILVGGQPAGASAVNAQWRLHKRKKGEVFLHQVFAREAAPRIIATTISVAE